MQTTHYHRDPRHGRLLVHHLAHEPVEGTCLHDVCIEAIDGPRIAYVTVRLPDRGEVDLSAGDLDVLIRALTEARDACRRADADHAGVAA